MDAAPDPSDRSRYVPVPFDVTVDRVGPWTIVRPEGEIDLATVGRVAQAAGGAAADLAIDLRAVTFLDSSGLRFLIEQDHRARDAGHAFAIVPGDASIQRLLQIAGLDTRLRVLEDGDATAGD
ncbi:MAG: STAS domain-containing protein [Solirubrobacteraceae bacterium]|nr:STAS domain-containing protein [Solirubrobacteraceae bacterium]